MSKQSYLIWVLTSLENERLPAWAYKQMIQQWKMDDDMLNKMIDLVQDGLKNAQKHTEE